MDPIREGCEQKPEAVKYFQKLEECNSRVESKSHTEESCAEELYEYVHHVDHCVSKADLRGKDHMQGREFLDIFVSLISRGLLKKS